jgi:hypothetical protein
MVRASVGSFLCQYGRLRRAYFSAEVKITDKGEAQERWKGMMGEVEIQIANSD